MWIPITLLLLIAFLPSVVYCWWIRNTERYAREPWFRILVTFVWGAGMAILITVLLELPIVELTRKYYIPGFTTLILAPVVEEFVKPLGIRYASLSEVEDGMVYGVACGLGFAATENLIYEGYAFYAGFQVFILTVLVRTISSTLLHASATAVTGYGIGKSVVGKVTPVIIPFFYLIAVTMHSAFNFFGSLREWYGLPLSIFFALISFYLIRAGIRRLDKRKFKA